MKDPLQDKFEQDAKLFDDAFDAHISYTEEPDDPTGEWVREKDSADGLNPEKRSIEVRPDEGEEIEGGDGGGGGGGGGQEDGGGSSGSGGEHSPSLWFSDQTSGRRIEFEFRGIGNTDVMFTKNPDGTWSKASDEHRALIGRAYSNELWMKAAGITERSRLTERETKAMAQAKEAIAKESEKDAKPQREKPEITPNVTTDNTSHLDQKREETQKKLESNDAKLKAESASNKGEGASLGKNTYTQNDGRIVLRDTDLKDKKTEGTMPKEPSPDDPDYAALYDQYISDLTEYEQSKKDADESNDMPPEDDSPEDDFLDQELEQDIANLEADLAEIDAILEMNKPTIDPERIVPAG